MDRLLDPLFELSPLAVYLLIAVFCWAEAAFFLGLVTPGEIAVVTGGILASREQVEFDVLLGVVVLATLVGNATGFYLGCRYGDDVLEWGPLQRFLGRPIRKAREFMLRRGEWAIVLGRVSTPSRVITPFLAGSSGMQYRRFLAFDVMASLIWAAVWLSAGYLLGESWDVVRDASGTAAILVLILFLLAIFIRWATARIMANRRRVEAAFHRSVRATHMQGVARFLAPGFHWLSRRLDPRVARGLSLTLCFLVLLVAVGGVGLVFSQTRAAWGLALIDFPVLEWMAETRTDEAVEISRTGLHAFHWPGIFWLVVPVMVLVAWRADSTAALRLGAGAIGAAAGAFLLDRFVLEGNVPNAEFPSVPVASAAALLVHATALTARLRDWTGAVGCAGLVTFLLCAVALGTVVAGWAAPSGIALGLALGLGWAAALELPSAARSPEPAIRDEREESLRSLPETPDG
ncbi:MAG: DedA family protein [Wenzhouxiangellaceae bacterium]|nr:DedA family protein [Wenzhouxiangellaceae bacterium]